MGEAVVGGTRPIRAVVVADDARSALVLAELRQSLDLQEHARARSAEELRSAVGGRNWDIVIADPTFSTLPIASIVQVLHELDRTIPLVVVCGRIGEEAAVELVRAGARDVVLFENLGRLGSVVRREVIGDSSARTLRDVLRTGLLSHGVDIGITLATFDGLFLDANDAFLRLVGYSRADLEAGRIHRDLITPAEFRDQDRRSVTMLQSAGAMELRQKEYIRRDGTRVPVLVTGMRLDDGTAVGLIALDVTDEKRVERELRRTTAFLDSIVENIPLMVFVKDAAELRFERLNRVGEEILGHRREELIGKSDYDLFTKEQADFFQAKDREALALPAAIDIVEEPIATPKGERWLRTMKMAIRDEVGTPRHLLGISEDITQKRHMAEELQRSEERLRQSQKMEAIGQLAGGIAHDFNNLLAVILSYADLASSSLREGDPVRADIAEIAAAGQHAADLTRQLLSFSRQQVAQPRVLDLNDVLMGIDKMLHRVVEEHIELKTVPGANLGRVRADARQIEQIVMNLVVNARDAMPDGGHLTIETANVELDEVFAQAHAGMSPGPHVMLAVSDTGAGMDKATLARVFEPFFTTKPVGKGTGLGLSTVYGIVRQSAGAIWVYSEPGKGTAFKIYFPRVDAALDERPSLALASGVSRRGTETVMVVEDEPQLRRLMTTVLGKSGYKVLQAAGPAEALLLGEQHPGVIHLLVTDVVMPQLNGRQLAERLKVTRPDMRVIFVSGYTGNIIAHNGLVDPGFTLVQKPFTTTALLAKIAEVLAPTA